MFHNPGGDWNPGRGDNPMDTQNDGLEKVEIFLKNAVISNPCADDCILGGGLDPMYA